MNNYFIEKISLRVKKNHVAISVVTRVASRAVVLILGFLTSVILAKKLGPELRGEYAVIVTMCTFLIQILSFGLPFANNYSIAKYPRSLPVLYGNSVLLSIIILFLLPIVIFSLKSFGYFSFLNTIDTFILLLLITSVSASVLYSLLQNILMGLSNFKLVNKIEISVVIIQLVMTTFVLYLLKASFAVILLIYVVCVWIQLSLSIFSLNKMLIARKLIFSSTEFFKLLPYSLKSFCSCFFAFFILKADLFIVRYYLGPEQTGIFAVASSLGYLLYLFPSIVGNILFPKLSACICINDRKKKALKVMTICGGGLFIASLLGSLLSSKVIAGVYGRAYIDAVYPCNVLIFGIVFYGMANILESFFAASGIPLRTVHFWAAAAIINLALNLLMVPPMGLLGAAYATSIAYVFVFLALYFYQFKFEKI